VAFDHTPASVSKIWYAPNHVRAWRADVYKQIDGHNPKLEILDDGELVMRTYLVTKFKHIDKCLYLYRISTSGSNTWLKRNKEIQDGVYPLYDKFIYKLVTRWAETNNLLKIDLGGRFSCPAGYKSVDLNGEPDYKFDLNKQWLLKDNSVGVLRAHDVIEHLKNPIHFMKEAYRVLTEGGYLMIMVPSTDGRGAFQDPTHVSFWNENSFWYYTRKEQSKYIDTPVRFQAVRLVTGYPSDWHKQNKIPYVYAQLQALKGQRVCGGVDI
jgi:SAM-dependent methyltransferase